MDALQFSKEIPASQIAEVFKKFFEEHIFAFYITKGIKFVSINSVTMDKASIMYSLKMIDDRDKQEVVDMLKDTSTKLKIYGKQYNPDIYVNGDLLCITINK